MRILRTGFFANNKERPAADVPVLVIIMLVVMLTAQTGLWRLRPPVNPFAEPLPPPVSAARLKLYGLNDSLATARFTMLWLQAFDNQPGISIPFRQLDYGRVIGWLNIILSLDGRGQYPLLAASRVYSEVPDDSKKRGMLEFVYEKFFEDPNRRWPSLAHATYVAKHQLKDLPLALKYATALSQQVSAENVPYWVKQMQIYVLEDMDEMESAKVLIGGLLDSGAIKDANELRFLQERLKKLEEGGKEGN